MSDKTRSLVELENKVRILNKKVDKLMDTLTKVNKMATTRSIGYGLYRHPPGVADLKYTIKTINEETTKALEIQTVLDALEKETT